MVKNKLSGFIVFVCVLGVIGLFHSFKDVKSEKILPKVIAHRGCTIDAPENTVKSIMSAAQNKADYAEFDVQETKDGVPVLLHDISLVRTTGINKNLSQVNYSELKDVAVGNGYYRNYKSERIPTLQQVMESAKGKIKLDIELKMYSNNNDLPNKVVNLIEKNNFVDNCIVTSFDYNALVKVKTLNPKIRTSYLIASKFNYKSSKWIDIYSFNDHYLTKNLIDSIHRDKKQIHVWVVNSDQDINNFIKLGVDGIITDDLQAYKRVIFENKI